VQNHSKGHAARRRLCPHARAWHIVGMTDCYKGFAFKVMSPDINSPGGKRRRQLLVVAKNVHDATAIARLMIAYALIADPRFSPRRAPSGLERRTRGSVICRPKPFVDGVSWDEAETTANEAAAKGWCGSRAATACS
jgi:hypothetical protein